MWFLYIFLIILFLIFVIPINFTISASERETKAYIRILFFKKMLDIEAKPETEEVMVADEEKEEEAIGVEEAPFKERLEKILLFADFFLDELEGVWRPLKHLIRSIRIVETTLFIQVSGDDPADVGALTGWLNAGVYAIYARLENFFNFKKTQINILGDFLEKGWDYSFKTTISISIFQLLPLAFAGAKLYFKFRKFNKAQIKEEVK